MAQVTRAARRLTREEEHEFLPYNDPSLPGLLNQRPLTPAVHAWLQTYHVDDYYGRDGAGTLLSFIVHGEMYTSAAAIPKAELVSLARDLLARGADPNAGKNGSILFEACTGLAPDVMVPLLLEAGADPNTTKDHKGRTALAFVLREVLKAQISCGVTAPVGMKTHWSELDTLELVRALLRSGAQLDAIENSGDSSLEYPFVDDQGRFVRGPLSAESILRSYDCFIPYEHTNTSQLPEIKRLVAGVRAAKGSYARYVKKEVLVLRALVRKRRATTADTNQRTAFDILARSPDEIAWRILGFRRW